MVVISMKENEIMAISSALSTSEVDSSINYIILDVLEKFKKKLHPRTKKRVIEINKEKFIKINKVEFPQVYKK